MRWMNGGDSGGGSRDDFLLSLYPNGTPWFRLRQRSQIWANIFYGDSFLLAVQFSRFSGRKSSGGEVRLDSDTSVRDYDLGTEKLLLDFESFLSDRWAF